MTLSKSELIIQRNKLIQEGKLEEAQKVLQQYWDLCKNSSKIELIKPIQEIKKQTIKNDVNETKEIVSLDTLAKINGIGKKTIKDIKAIYSSLDDLIESLKSDKEIPLRDDVVSKLKSYFL